MSEIGEEKIAGTAKFGVNSGKCAGVYDKKLLWKANLYVDEHYLEFQEYNPDATDWNGVNSWDDLAENEWQMYIDYSDPLNPGNVIDSHGDQIPILPWTHPDVQFVVDGTTYPTYTGNIYSSVAYIWTGNDNFPRFNEKVSIQAQVSQDHTNANTEEPSLAPNDSWFDYDRTSYLPALGIYNHVDKIDNEDISALDAGLNCTWFMIRAKEANNIYSNGEWLIGNDNVYTYNNHERIIHGDSNLLVPGDIIRLSGHWAIVQSIEYNEDDRITSPQRVKCIHATTWSNYWMVQKGHTLWNFFSGWNEFDLVRPKS